MNTIQKGEIYYADLSPTAGSEQFGLRPVLIIQNDIGNKYGNTTIIAPLTSKQKKQMPTHVTIDLQALPAKSIVLLEQIRCIDQIRLHEYIGKVDEPLMEKIDDAILASFGISRSEPKENQTISCNKRDHKKDRKNKYKDYSSIQS